MAKAPRPRWTIPETFAVANAYQSLLARFLPRFSDRGIDAAWAQAYADKLTEFANAQESQGLGKMNQASASRGVELALATIRTETAGIRNVIKLRFPKRKDVQRAFGVGSTGSGLTVAKGRTLAKAILDAAAAFPAETTAARILQRDLDKLAAARKVLNDADLNQEGAKGGKVGATAARDSIHHELLALIDELRAVAEVEFASEPEILAQWRGPIPTKKGSKKKAPGEAA